MAFPCRPEAHHAEILDRLCRNLGIKAKNKVVLKVVEDYETIIRERDEYRKLSLRLGRELESLKTAVRNKLDADAALMDFVK